MCAAPQISDFLQSLKSFAATAQTGSQSKAAVMLGRTQSAISQQIKHLETELQVDLFIRKGNVQVVTDFGQNLLAHVNTIFSEVDQIYELSRKKNHEQTVNITFTFAVEHDFLPAFLKEMDERYSDIPINARLQLYRDAEQDVLRGVSHMAVVTQSTYDERLRFDPLFETPQFLFCARDCPLVLPEHIDFDFLAACKLVVPQQGTYQYDELERLFTIHGKKIEPFKQVKYISNVLSVVQHGLGYGIINRSSIREDARFRSAPLSHLMPPRCFGLLSLFEADFSPNVKQVYTEMKNIKKDFVW